MGSRSWVSLADSARPPSPGRGTSAVLGCEDRRRGPKPGAAEKEGRRAGEPASAWRLNILRDMRLGSLRPPCQSSSDSNGNLRVMFGYDEHQRGKSALPAQLSLDKVTPLWHFPHACVCTGQMHTPGKGSGCPPGPPLQGPALRQGRSPCVASGGRCTALRKRLHPGTPHIAVFERACHCGIWRSDVAFGRGHLRKSQIAVRGHVSCCGVRGPGDLVIRSNGSLSRTGVGAISRRTALCILGMARAVASNTRLRSGRRVRRQRS
jgi:hypothetical protein